MHPDDEGIRRLLDGRHHDPFEILGPRPAGKGKTLVRTYIPGVHRASVLFKGKKTIMEQVHEAGLFECTVPGDACKDLYKITAEDTDGNDFKFHDPYCFPPVLTDFDLHLISEGTHYGKYERLGAHIRTERGIRGVNFAVWAPNAKGISVVGDFNSWDGRRHQMRIRGSSGVWEIFIPDIGEGTLYKFEIRTESEIMLRADPYGFYSELRPMTASIVWDMDKYEWGDDEWMGQRPQTDWLSSGMSIYEVHLGSWMRNPDGGFLSYSDLARKLVEYVKKMGYTHIEVLPVQEHPYDASWGYQVLGYFSVTSRFGTPDDFMHFVDHCHKNGIGVIIDWVPAHFPKDAHGLAHFDGSFLYEHSHPFMREHQDWGTHIFNYGRNEVANFLLNSALFWLRKYHIDGLRVDAVASMLYLDYSREEGEWIPNRFGGNENIEAIEFIKRFNELCHREYPGVLTIAEESTAWPMVSRPTYMGGLGFSLKWNMGWMHDILDYFSNEPVFRKYHHHCLTFGLIYAFHENFVLVLSHDEVVHGKGALIGKMPGDHWQKFANLRLLYGYMYAHPGKKMLFMGGDIGQWSEWDSASSVEWHLMDSDPHVRLQHYFGDLNRLLASEPALHELDFSPEGFEWIDFSDADSSVVSFIRKARDPEDFLVIVCNFTPIPRTGYRIGVPRMGVYKETMNSDSASYWGTNTGNTGEVQAEDVRFNQWPFSLSLTLPPLGMLVLKPER
jgi:1,4-alpha-glucan branching enzyme